jgi:plasmid maintenance system antidote protein VapI
MRDEILDELHLTVGDAAEALGVRRATLSDLLKGNSALSSPNRSGRSRHGMPARYR